MDIATFLSKADALKKKGVMALFSSDLQNLKSEVENAGAQLHAERIAAQKEGRKPAYCPPSKSGLNSHELLAHFRTIPPAQRGRMQVKEGLRDLVAKKYPCR